MAEISELIRRVNGGDQSAREALFATAYGELHKLATTRLYRHGRSTMLDTTALVHESYLRLSKVGNLQSDQRAAFFLYASRTMRSVIVDALRASKAAKRGAGERGITLDSGYEEVGSESNIDALRLHDALIELEHVNADIARVVEMRYFGGFTDLEIAQALGTTDRTVRRYHTKAVLLLRAMLG